LAASAQLWLLALFDTGAHLGGDYIIFTTWLVNICHMTVSRCSDLSEGGHQ